MQLISVVKHSTTHSGQIKRNPPPSLHNAKKYFWMNKAIRSILFTIFNGEQIK